MAKAKELKSDYDEAFEIKRTGWERQLKQGMLDLDFYFRAQHTAEEAKKAQDQNRELYTLDYIGRQVDLLWGYEIKNRHILMIVPQGKPSAEDKACSQHSAVLMNIMTMAGGYNVLSETFKWGPLVQGSNLIEIWRDREGDLQFSRLGWNQFLLNPGLTKTDLSDCGDIAIGRWIDEKRIKFLLPNNSDDLEGISALTNVNRWDFLSDPVLQNRDNRMLMEEWWQRETKFEEIVISRVNISPTQTVSAFLTGDEKPLTQFADDYYSGNIKLAKFEIKRLHRQNGGPAFSKINKPTDVIKLTVFVNNQMVFDGENPLKANDYNHIWVHGDWCAECPRDDIKLQSFVRRLRDPQRARNRRVNQIYDIIESQAHGVRKTRSKYLMNPEEAYKSGQGVVLQANDEFPDEMPLGELFMQTPASDVPAGLFTALGMTDKAETETGGLNDEIFGTDDKDIPAILAKHRTGQALTGQGGMFQDFRAVKRQLGIKVSRRVQLLYPPKKVAQIINEQPIPEFYKRSFDCNPVEGLQTESQQELFFMLLLQIRQAFPKEAHKIPLSEVAKYSSIMKEELMEIIQRAEQKEAQAMQQAQKTQQVQEALNIELVKGNVLANRGIAEAQRAKAVEDQSDAALNRAKTAAEIQDLVKGRALELLKSAIELEKIGQLNQEAKIKS